MVEDCPRQALAEVASRAGAGTPADVPLDPRVLVLVEIGRTFSLALPHVLPVVSQFVDQQGQSLAALARRQRRSEIAPAEALDRALEPLQRIVRLLGAQPCGQGPQEHQSHGSQESSHRSAQTPSMGLPSA